MWKVFENVSSCFKRAHYKDMFCVYLYQSLQILDSIVKFRICQGIAQCSYVDLLKFVWLFVQLPRKGIGKYFKLFGVDNVLYAQYIQAMVVRQQMIVHYSLES
eukprot:TRINITY_DN1490_c1_g1_i1.p6 TRINITY_DN1490_c1_g1~~TRINITY_DN1490_c1_g1_i1.p6  ORF type:complete len:103 (+),score=0.56 TRINITY_DN1490_c1_g1_i1:678-986(+)